MRDAQRDRLSGVAMLVQYARATEGNEMPVASLRFLGANRQVTGSCYLLEAGGQRVLIDCGMFQERDLEYRNWQPKPVDMKSVDHLLLTHAHLDHVGLIPCAVRDGFAGTIFTTAPTVELAAVVLRDSARLQEEDAAFKTRRHVREGRADREPVVPLYTKADVEKALPLFRGVSFREPVRLGKNIGVRFLEAGHILGAASLEITIEEHGVARRLVMSGDLGQPGVPIVPDPAVIEDADAVVIESTYGDRDHPPRVEARDVLAEAVNDTLRRGGNVLIPTFAIERAQELLLELAELIASKHIPPVRMFLDSPMAADATEVYADFPQYMDDAAREALGSERLAGARRLLTVTRSADESKALNLLRGCIILAGAGMCTGGRIKHHLVQHLGRPESTVVFAGFQSEGTLGRQIRDGNPEVRVLGQTIRVRARICSVEGFSGHADRGQLVAWLSHLKRAPRFLAITHGEEQAAEALAALIRERRGYDAVVPRYEQKLDL